MKQNLIVWAFRFQDTQERLQQEEDARNQLFQGKKKLEQEISGLKKDIEDLELTVQKVNMKLWWRWLLGYDAM
jgi:thiamine pyrophosphokinase